MTTHTIMFKQNLRFHKQKNQVSAQYYFGVRLQNRSPYKTTAPLNHNRHCGNLTVQYSTKNNTNKMTADLCSSVTHWLDDIWSLVGGALKCVEVSVLMVHGNMMWSFVSSLHFGWNNSLCYFDVRMEVCIWQTTNKMHQDMAEGPIGTATVS